MPPRERRPEVSEDLLPAGWQGNRTEEELLATKRHHHHKEVMEIA